MKQIFFAAADFSGSPIHYHLLITRTGELTQYGVCADWRREEVSIPELSTREEAVLELLDALRRGVVPPLALRDVVDDWLER